MGSLDLTHDLHKNSCWMIIQRVKGCGTSMTRNADTKSVPSNLVWSTQGVGLPHPLFTLLHKFGFSEPGMNTRLCYDDMPLKGMLGLD